MIYSFILSLNTPSSNVLGKVFQRTMLCLSLGLFMLAGCSKNTVTHKYSSGRTVSIEFEDGRMNISENGVYIMTMHSYENELAFNIYSQGLPSIFLAYGRESKDFNPKVMRRRVVKSDDFMWLYSYGTDGEITERLKTPFLYKYDTNLNRGTVIKQETTEGTAEAKKGAPRRP